MDQNIAALISAISEANMQARRDHELAMAQLVQTQNEAQQQARREHEQALAQLMQGQKAFMERFGAAMNQPWTTARGASGSLVDQRGVGKGSEAHRCFRQQWKRAGTQARQGGARAADGTRP